MAKKKSPEGMARYKIVALSHLCKAADFSYTKLYKNLSEVSGNLSNLDKTVLAGTAQEEMAAFFKFLGFKIKLERMD